MDFQQHLNEKFFQPRILKFADKSTSRLSRSIHMNQTSHWGLSRELNLYTMDEKALSSKICSIQWLIQEEDNPKI